MLFSKGVDTAKQLEMFSNEFTQLKRKLKGNKLLQIKSVIKINSYRRFFYKD